MDEVNVLDQMQTALRFQNFSNNIEKAYIYWARAFLDFHGGIDPADLRLPHVEAFLRHLSDDRYAPKQTLSQALRAILFMYKEALHEHCEWLEEYVKQREGKRDPNILTPKECQRLLSNLFGQDWLIASLIYGSGLRLSECVRLRIRDIDLEQKTILVRDTQGDIQRMTLLPNNLESALRTHFQDRKLLHIKDIADGFGEVDLPEKISGKYPNAKRSWGWQYVFADSQRTVHSNQLDARPVRQHASEKNVKTAVEHAALEAGVYHQASTNTLRNSFAVHLIQQGTPAKVVETLLGHGENYSAAHMVVTSPLDRLLIH